MTTRTNPPEHAPERETLEGFLDFHRDTLRWKCEGLSDEQLRIRGIPPSGMSLLGIVRHLADVERHWFRRVLVGEDAPPLFYSQEKPNDDFDNLESVPASEAFATWTAEYEAGRRNCADFGLDDLAKNARDEMSLRWIYVHMIEEYARHNGHADLLREQIDGETGE